MVAETPTAERQLPTRWSFVVALGCATHHPWGSARIVERAPGSRVVEIVASRRGFIPDHVIVRVGERVDLRFTRVTASSCAKEVVLRLDANRTTKQTLPLDEPVDITLLAIRAGELGFSCGMSMHGGTIEVRP